MPTSGIGHFDSDEWELFHVDEDRSESVNLAAQNPEKLERLKQIWFEEAGKYEVLPLDDRRPFEILADPRPQPFPPTDTYVYYPGAAEVPEAIAVNTRSRSFRILASVDIDSPQASGVIFAHGSRFGGHALFLVDGTVHYVYNFLGIPPEQTFAAPVPLVPGRYVLGVEFGKESTGEHGETHGQTTLWVNDTQVASGPMRTQLAFFTPCGDGLCIGRDSGDAVSRAYPKPSVFRGGTIAKVEISVGHDRYVDLEKEALALLARE